MLSANASNSSWLKPTKSSASLLMIIFRRGTQKTPHRHLPVFLDKANVQLPHCNRPDRNSASS